MLDRLHSASGKLAGARRATVAVVIAGTLTACGALKRVDDCERLVEVVNPELAEVKFQLPDAGADAGAYEQIAAIYERLSQQVSEIETTDSGLRRSLLSYKEVLERAARTSRSYAEALGKPASSRAQRKERGSHLKRLRAQAKNEALREAAVVRKLNALCHPE